MPDIVDELIEKVGHHYDYGSNVIKRTYPKGLDCEIFKFSELERAHRQSKEREHVTTWIRIHAMSRISLEDPQDFSKKRITLDTDNDYSDLKRYGIDKIYNYEELKKILPKIQSTQEWSIYHELGRV